MWRLPEARTGERGFTKSPVFPIKVGTAAPGGTQIDLPPGGGCPHLCLGHRAGVLLQGLEQATPLTPCICLCGPTGFSPKDGLGGLGSLGVSGALPVLATALLFTHWALGEGTLLVLVKRCQQQVDTTLNTGDLREGLSSPLAAGLGRGAQALWVLPIVC